ncbi:MAG: hypothetical protein AVDCRST_MAG87-1808, partial [uncultured Thermomicrobiales bacterium]
EAALLDGTRRGRRSHWNTVRDVAPDPASGEPDMASGAPL